VCEAKEEHARFDIEGTFVEDEEENFGPTTNVLSGPGAEHALGSSNEAQVSDELLRVESPEAEPASLLASEKAAGTLADQSILPDKIQPDILVAGAKAHEEVPTAGKLCAQDNDVRIAFSGIEPCVELVRKLNSALAGKGPNRARSVSDVKIATHLVLESVHCMKRTTKLLVALNCNIKAVVGLQWLEDSVAAACALPVDKVMAGSTVASSSRGYIVHDADKELLWKFNLQTVLQLPKCNIFSNCSVYVMPGICGVCAPPFAEFKEIIESGNGHWIEALPAVSKMSAKWFEQQATYAREVAQTEEPHCIICISQSEKMPKTLPASIKKLLAGPVKCGVWSVETILLGCLRQVLDLAEGMIVAPGENNRPDEKLDPDESTSNTTGKRANLESADSRKKRKR